MSVLNPAKLLVDIMERKGGTYRYLPHSQMFISTQDGNMGFYVGGVSDFPVVELPLSSMNFKVVSGILEVFRNSFILDNENVDDLRFGVWLDEETNTVFFEVSQLVISKDEAIRLGRERGEKEIWDIEDQKSIRLQDDIEFIDEQILKLKILRGQLKGSQEEE